MVSAGMSLSWRMQQYHTSGSLKSTDISGHALTCLGQSHLDIFATNVLAVPDGHLSLGHSKSHFCGTDQ